MADKLTPAQVAAGWLARRPVFLDTETTGLDGQAEVCDLAVIDWEGNVLLNTLVRPMGPIPAQAYMIHGISNDDVAGAPRFCDVVPDLVRVLHQRLVVIYNAAFDLRILLQSATAYLSNAHWLALECDPVCAMELYAEHYGDWSNWHRNYRWQSLEAAARQCGLQWTSTAHRAHADAEMTRRLIHHLARGG